jgi:hypothetical protein
MASYDEAGRQGCKESGAHLLPWLDGFAKEPMAADFARWDDTRRTSWPGGPERTDDVVCVLRRRADGKPAHLIVEVATEPKADDVARLGIYQLLLAMEVGAVLPNGPPVYGAIIHLTGSKKDGPLMLTGSATAPGVLVEVIEVWLADVSAEEMLTLIEADKLPPSVLLWVVLMRGGGAPKLIERWKKAVEKKLSADKWGLYRSFALTFAELIPELVNWQNALEDWQVRESPYLKSFEDKGRQEGELRARRADVIKGLSLKLKSAVPEPIRLAIEGTNDLDTLNRWFEALFEVESWDEFQKRMKQP